MFAHGSIGLAIALVAAPQLLAQVILEIESRDHRTTPPRTETSFVVCDGQQLAIGLTSGKTSPDGGAIYRSGRRELVVLDHRNRSYMVLDAQAMQRLANQMNQAMGQMESALANLPPQQRAFAQQMMGNPMSASQTLPRVPDQVRRTTDVARCFGYPATRYEVWRDGRKVREMYVTDWSNIDGGRDVADAFADLSRFAEELARSLPGGNLAPGGALDDGLFTVMDRVSGFPVGVREYREDGSIEREWALRSARRQRVDPATFAPPGNYRRQALPGG